MDNINDLTSSIISLNSSFSNNFKDEFNNILSNLKINDDGELADQKDPLINYIKEKKKS